MEKKLNKKTYKKNLINKIFFNIFYFKTKYRKNYFLKNNIYKKYFNDFNKLLQKNTYTKLEPHYKQRFYEINKIINKYNIKKIVEIGSGRTTFIFNLYSNLDITSYEQDKRWIEILTSYFKKIKLKYNIIHSNVIKYKNGAKLNFKESIIPDLLYIDGPYINRKSEFDTFTGKPAYYDFEFFFKKNMPKIIMIEGRTDTVDEILKNKNSINYKFYPEFIYCIQRKKYFSAFAFRRHSLFIKKDL